MQAQNLGNKSKEITDSGCDRKGGHILRKNLEPLTVNCLGNKQQESGNKFVQPLEPYHIPKPFLVHSGFSERTHQTGNMPKHVSITGSVSFGAFQASQLAAKRPPAFLQDAAMMTASPWSNQTPDQAQGLRAHGYISTRRNTPRAFGFTLRTKLV